MNQTLNAGLVVDAQDDPEEGRGQGTDHWKGGKNLRGESKNKRDIIHRPTLATLKGLRNYISVSCDILRRPCVFLFHNSLGGN